MGQVVELIAGAVLGMSALLFLLVLTERTLLRPAPGRSEDHEAAEVPVAEAQ